MLTGIALAYDLPEIIGALDGQNDSLDFGGEFCWVGDQNGDGFDDLLVQHEPRYRGENYVNQVKLYFGGEQMDNEPDMIFRSEGFEGGYETFGARLNYLGKLTGEHSSWFVVTSFLKNENHQILGHNLYLYRGGEALDNQPDIVMRSTYDNYRQIGQGHRMRPADFNGDGYDDMIACQKIDEIYSRMLIFHGGEEFDTIPDWENIVEFTGLLIGGLRFSTGYDVNGDGYDDVLMVRRTGAIFYSLYLGGDPMDTTSVFELGQNDFEDRTMIAMGFSMIPDVNRDGYDDWVIYYCRLRNEDDGYLLFFGSDEPDAEPDRDLAGNHMHGGHTGDVSGGDFNGDGYGDVVSAMLNGFMSDGELQLYFGSRWVDVHAAITVNCAETWSENYRVFADFIGAVGDYNGDGISDFVGRHGPPFAHWSQHVTVLGGNRDWEVGISDETLPQEFTLSLSLHPNPFNRTLNLEYELPLTGLVQLNVYITVLDSIFAC